MLGPAADPLFINCTLISEFVVNCNGNLYDEPEKRLTPDDTEFWIYVGVYSGLVLIAGIMSGLTMGLLSLDPMTLTIMTQGGTASEHRYAKRILPLVKRHHLLLVTLLLANAAAVEAMPIFLDRVSSPVIAIVSSVTAVLIFGEVIPQAICTRYGLAIGAFFTPLVYFLMAIFFIVAWPLSKLLDCILGDEHGTFYRRGQLKALVDLHGPNVDQSGGLSRASSVHGNGKDEHLTIDEVHIIKGALDMINKTAHTAMVPISKVYMISADERMDYEVMTHMLTVGHSRIPVYDGSRSDVIAVLLTKTLIKIDPAEGLPVRQIVTKGLYSRPPLYIEDNMPLYDLLNLFQTGKSHLAMVRQSVTQASLAGGDASGEHTEKQPLLKIEDEPYKDVPEVVGIITLEDVLEQLLQEEIEDETDVDKKASDMGRLLQVAKAKLVNIQKQQLHRCKSQPHTSSSSKMEGHKADQMARQLSSSQPDESHIPACLGSINSEPDHHRLHAASQPALSSLASPRRGVSFADDDAEDPPLVSFD